MSEEEIRETLKEIYEKGFEIRNILKEKHNYPSKRSKEEMLIDPEIFYYSLFESFWRLFKIISENIKNPLIQPWIRVIIEQASDIFWYYHKNEIEKKEISCKYWLCALGFVGGKQGNLNYDRFLDFLENKNEKNKFLTIKNEGYPPEKIHRIWHDLFPSINENSLPDFMEKYFVNLSGNSIKKFQLDRFYRDMSLYHHPNIVMDNLEREFNDKSHIFRCFTLMLTCAISLIKFSMEETIKEKQEINFSENFYKKVNELVKKLYKGRNKNEN